MSRPTLRDVAAKTGLSVTQVSRALNDHDDVAASTKELARRVAAELRYIPNLEARRLKDPKARTGALGIILPHESLRFNDPYFGEVLTAMAAEAATEGMQLSLSTHPEDTPITDPYDRAIRSNQVDGFILLRTTTDDPRIGFLLDAGVPFVSFGRPAPSGPPADERGFAAVEVSDDCFDPVVEHLVDLGHRRIACIVEPSRFAVGTARFAAFGGAAARAGLALAADDVVEAGFIEGSGTDAALTILRSRRRPSAIVAMNDLLALGVLEAAAECDLRVPHDLTVIGFDDIPAARQVRPALTTVRQSPASVGTALVQLLNRAIEAGRPGPDERRIATSLVIRESSGPAAD